MDEERILLGIRTSTLVASALVVMLVGLAHFGLRWWTQRRHRREQAGAAAPSATEPSARRWLSATLLNLVAPVALLLWIHGLLDIPDNRKARAIYTQITILRKLAMAVIGIFAFASMLMVFESVRQFGTAILASAGVAGIVVGFAAQRSIATLLAGFQIALTQPIRLDDVVIVENEWGRIEEITLTYVVVSIWDQRRLILPITYFLEKPFQNWTRASADLLAYVFLYVDYRVPIERLRAKLTAILQSSPLWDRRVNVLQVTDATEHAVQIRALASAANSSHAWELRCEIREKLVMFLQQEHPEALPRLRLLQDAAHPA